MFSNAHGGLTALLQTRSDDSGRALNSLLGGRTTVLKVFGRLGCPFTRYDAHCLSQQKKKLSKVGATLIGVTFESGEDGLGLKGLWDGEMYLDTKREVYRFFCLQRMFKLKALKCSACKETSKTTI
ncbi:hypothetical protein DSO57_1000291 [Entomophthora muscae]|uniref:Uncharacterized protein n=1 Tax=Entomophthora muscae TaxID=34485 RepID=A0ACC2SZ50_9FUNG|nr:hypothetical protein DSO57_1000291 [Entomophthora muscae]